MEVTQVEELAPEKFGIEPTKATELKRLNSSTQ